MFEQLAQGGHRALRLGQGLLQASEVGGNELGPSRLIGSPEYGADVVERHAEIPEPSDHLRDRELVARVSAVAGDRIDVCGFEQADPVVVAQGLHAEEGDPGEVADGQRASHVASLDPPVGGESTGGDPLTLP